ncbi:uncharacterized protein LOC119724185 [Patiria miniata]|uniref:Uncharacterized protein n=1 Tax=Patiria miniata TaxID=46514 RepID=A0A913ZJ12_PATMI|nr:uncharacterized protein LOC119724185 [Patiria miniata]
MLPLLLSLVLLLVTNFPRAQSSVCSYSCPVSRQTKCGWWGWDRCTKYRSKTCYRCCSGWSGSGCYTPICSPSCSNGGTCTRPDYCSSCNRGYYSPRCYRCTSIANCVDVHCSSSYNQQCASCDGDYGSTRGAAYKRSSDNRRCIKQCSWRTNSNACYPGYCANGQCSCSSGFSGQDCRTMGSSQAPVISERRAFLIKDNMTLESPVFQNSTSTVYTDVIDFTRIRVVWKVSYQPTGLPSRPPYISSVNLGVASATTSVTVRTAQGVVFNIGSSKSCWSSSYSPRTDLLHCEFQEDISYRTWTPSTGDVIRSDMVASSGGRLNLYNRDRSNSIMSRNYNGASASVRASASFTFAMSGATHCVRSNHCRTTMLNVGEKIISEPGITVTWEGWSDRHAGIKEFSLDVRQMSGTVGDEMTEILDTPAVYQGVSESGLSITLPQAGVYSFVLSVVDNLDNVRRCRRFVFLDNDPDDLTVRTDSPMRVQVFSHGWETQGAWLNDIKPVGSTKLLLDWQGHFTNEMHHSRGLLKPIGVYANGIIDADYDQNFGKRGRAGVPNALGVRKFRVFSDVDHSGGRTINNASDDKSDHWNHVGVYTNAFVFRRLVDGDSIRLWVEARDIAGHYVRDSVLVHVDSSPPVIEDTKIAVTEFAISVHFRAFDEHSGIKAIDWWLFDNETNSVVESGHEVVVPLNVTENITTCDPPACLCTPLGDCYATAQAFKPTLPAGIEERDFFIEFSVTNNAGLARNDTIKPTLTAENVGTFAEALVKDTNDTSSIDDSAVVSTADLLDSIVNIQDTSAELTESVVMVVSNLLQVDDDQLGDTDAVARSLSRIVRSLCRQISNVLAAGGNVSFETRSLAVRAMAFHPRDLADGLGFAALGGESAIDLMTGMQIDVYGPDSEIPMEQVVASVELPAQIADKFSGADSIPVSFIMYQSSRLFRSQLTNATPTSGVSKFIDSRVIAAAVDCALITDLPDDAPVVTAFLQDKMMKDEDTELQTTECVFWDFSLRDGIGEWSTEGCRRRPSVGGRTVCHCNHTTNFAVLVSIYEPISSFALDVFSKFGCGVSVVALIITIFVYSAIRSLRALEASRILISFCFSLLLLYLVFLAGVENTSNRAGCITAAVLMHYFVLTSMAWMGVEAANLYLKLVKVFNSDVQHFMIKASIVAWGVPMIVVIIILAVDYTEYDNQDSCFLKAGPAFYLGEFLFIGLVLLFNLFAFVLVIRKLMSSASKTKGTSDEGQLAKIAWRLKSMASVTVLLGLTLAFGLLSVIKEASLVFQVLFCVFNSLLGLLIFLLFVVWPEKVREGVSNLVRRRREGFPESSTSSNRPISTSRTRKPSVGPRNEGAKRGEADSSIYEVIDIPCQSSKMVTSKGKAQRVYQDLLTTNAQSNTSQGKKMSVYQDLNTTEDQSNKRMKPKAKTQREPPVFFRSYSTGQKEAPLCYENTDIANVKPSLMQFKNKPTASGKTKKPKAVPLKFRKDANPQREASRHYEDIDVANDEPSSTMSKKKPTTMGITKKPPAVPVRFRKDATPQREASRHYENNDIVKKKPTSGGKTKKPSVTFRNDATKQGPISHSYESPLSSQSEPYEDMTVGENDYM